MSISKQQNTSTITLVEYENAKTCKECPTHACCKIYATDVVDIRDKPSWFKEWVEGFHEHPEDYGVEPFFDPLEVHMRGHEAEWNALVAKGIDPEFCQYYNAQSGCIIERERRPTQCRQYNCGRLTETDDRIDIVLEVADEVPSTGS
ncbi:MAG: hypothetical protein OK456_06560 [Thaumarchaeota archaeon]|nr:hypothetical protein [Nitrososphaerota archaeon]